MLAVSALSSPGDMFTPFGRSALEGGFEELCCVELVVAGG